jgi:glycerol-3-phosphate dehydrogenase
MADGATPIYDVAVIGAGVVGAAIARELSRYRLRVALIEAEDDVGVGTSKANTAIWHTGFDAKPGSLEATLLRRGHELLEEFVPQAGIPVERIGALLVAWNEVELAALDDIIENARRNGYQRAARVSVSDLYAREPNLGGGVLGGLEVPGEHIICPFTTPLAFATQAVVNGVELRLDSPVERIEAADGSHALAIGGPRPFRLAARFVVNAAGLFSDVVDRWFGHETFAITPRRGELIVFDKLARPLLSHVLLPVPTKVTKGVLVSPTVFGNVMLGPTAEDLDDKAGTQSSAAGLATLLEKGRRIMPRLLDEEVTSVYAGLRAATEHSDYQIQAYPEQRYICAGGIRSTGLSASMGIAEYVTGLLVEAGLGLTAKDEFLPVRMPQIGEAGLRPYQDRAAIAARPAFGRHVCHCERVTEGEILDALRSPVPARSVDGLRRRTRATMGRCQGFYCSARVTQLTAQAAGRSVAELLGLERERPA